MAEAELKREVAVSAESFYRAVTAYDRYPEAVEGCRAARVVETQSNPDGSSQIKTVQYDVSMLKDLSYTLKHSENPSQGSMSWELSQSDFLKKNSGSWRVRSLGEKKSEVHYQIQLEFKFPAPGFVVKKLIQTQLPKMFDQFVDLARSLDK